MDQRGNLDQEEGAKVLNRDEGVYSLSHVYDKLLQQQRTVHSVDGKKYASRGSEASESAHYWGSLPLEDETV